MLNITDDIRQLKHSIETKAQHPYLLQFIQKPLVDDDKLILLWGLFSEMEVKEQNQYIMATMLVQIALDTHEIVTNSEKEETPGMLKNRQLQVLAGDYYSGLYYQGLAMVGNIDMIRILSSAIKRINDHKIILYQQAIDDIPTLLEAIKAVEASLVHKLADYYKKPHWKVVSEDLLLLRRLSTEKNSYRENGQSVVYDALRKIASKRMKNEMSAGDMDAFIQRMWNECIAVARQSVKLSIQKLTPGNGELLKQFITILQQTDNSANSYVKEG